MRCSFGKEASVKSKSGRPATGKQRKTKQLTARARLSATPLVFWAAYSSILRATNGTLPTASSKLCVATTTTARRRIAAAMIHLWRAPCWAARISRMANGDERLSARAARLVLRPVASRGPRSRSAALLARLTCVASGDIGMRVRGNGEQRRRHNNCNGQLSQGVHIT